MNKEKIAFYLGFAEEEINQLIESTEVEGLNEYSLMNTRSFINVVKAELEREGE